jgi:hypothetical protein
MCIVDTAMSNITVSGKFPNKNKQKQHHGTKGGFVNFLREKQSDCPL